MANKVTDGDTQTLNIELEDGTTLIFKADRDAYIKVVNGIGKNAFQTMHNFLVSTVHEDNEKQLFKMLGNPANVQELFSEVFEQYSPDIKVVLKKRKSAPMN